MNEHGYLSPYPSPPRSVVVLSPVPESPALAPARLAGPVGEGRTGVSETGVGSTCAAEPVTSVVGAPVGEGRAGVLETSAGTTGAVEPASPVTSLTGVPWAGGLASDWHPK
jgi:hypothetical protein